MDQDETKQDNSSPKNESELQEQIEKLTESLNNFSAELNTIKAQSEKGKSAMTTLKVLFYTGLAVLLLGFIYTNQTLQRAQSHNLEANINSLQSRVNYTLFSLERKLHEEIISLGNLVNGESGNGLHKSIRNMNRALDELQPETQTMDALMKKVQRDSKELSKMVSNLEKDEIATPQPVP
mgnify:CR=1 FL=1